MTPRDALGLGLLLLVSGFEAVGDHKLARFRGNPANVGRLMNRGLWRYTRHPN
jgi:steroid 5-alpha reductase family enzyme